MDLDLGAVFAYAALGTVAGLLILQLLPLLRARRARGRQLSALDPALQQRFGGHPRALLYFWSPQCGMCRRVTPIVDELQAERGDIFKIDVQAEPGTARALGVMATPSFVVVEDGRIASVLLGGRSEDRIRALLGR